MPVPAEVSQARRARARRRRWLLLILPLTAFACERAPDPEARGTAPLFVEVTAEMGLPLSGAYPDGRYLVPEVMAAGVALLDYDGDGDFDLYQVVHPPPMEPFALALEHPAPNRLYAREGRGVFREVPEAAGAGDPGYGMGVAVGDFDNDGAQDLYVTNYGPNRLYRNRGDGRFEEVTQRAGLDDAAGRAWGIAAAFLDYDGDGWLDLFVVNYLVFDPQRECLGDGDRPDYCGPLRFAGDRDALYRNNGDGTFRNVSDAAGIHKPGRGLGVVGADLTGDCRVDIYVGNDQEPNFLWVQAAGGTFSDEAMVRGVAVNGAGHAESSMGIALGDADGDGGLDLFATHFADQTNTLYLSGPEGIYRDRSASSGLSIEDLPFTGWGCAFFDVDHDGDLDLAVVNGRVNRATGAQAGVPLPQQDPGPFWRRYAERNFLFRNNGAGVFESVAAEGGDFTARAGNSRGLATGDLDRDGDLDLVTTALDNTVRVFRNDAPAAGSHWLSLRLTTGPRDALGALARIAVRAPGREGGVRVAVRPVVAAQSYGSSSEPRAHVALRPGETVEHVDVLWAEGEVERFTIPGHDQEVVLRRGAGSRPRASPR